VLRRTGAPETGSLESPISGKGWLTFVLPAGQSRRTRQAKRPLSLAILLSHKGGFVDGTADRSTNPELKIALAILPCVRREMFVGNVLLQTRRAGN
jgi:hypothetical protein